MLKGHLVCNATLAQLADRYGITELLIAAPSALYVTRAQQKTRGSLFESWIAGVFFSSLNGHEMCNIDAHVKQDDPSLKGGDPTTEAGPPCHHEEQVSTGDTDTTSDNDDDTSDDDAALAALIALKLLNPQDEPRMELSSNLLQQTASTTVITPKTEGEAYEHINTWLRPLFTPIAHWALE